MTPDPLPVAAVMPASTPIWLTVKEAAQRARCSEKIIRRAVQLRKLKGAVANERGDLRFRPQWIDDWLDAAANPVEIHR